MRLNGLAHLFIDGDHVAGFDASHVQRLVGNDAPLRRQIERLDGAALSPPSAGELHVLARPEDTVVSAWLQSVTARGSGVCHWPLSHHFDWAAAEAMNTTLVPAHALARMMASICE